MKQFMRQFVMILVLSGVVLLTACSSSGGGFRSGGYGVYDGYGYPYRGYGYGCCYDDDDYDDYRRDRAEERRERVRERRESTNLTRPSPMGGGMGRPAGLSRGGGDRRGR